MPVTACSRTPAGDRWQRYVGTRGRQVLRALGVGRREVSLAIVDDGEMRSLNHAYRRRNRPTDVLAFALDESDAETGRVRVPHAPLGDVVISIDTATRQARESRCALAARIDALVIHGILHLVGYDHEISRTEERRMARRARELRAALPPMATPPVSRGLLAVSRARRRRPTRGAGG